MKKLVVFCFFLVLFLNFVSSLSLTVHVPEKYLDVVAGERVYFEIQVKYPENPQRKDLKLQYRIEDVNNNLISQTKVLKAVETQASFVDFIVIPESTKKGLYLINILIEDYGDLSQEVGASFNVQPKGIGNVEIYFIIVIGAIFLMGILFVILFLKLKRK
jgi:hypothetical protein